MVLVYEVGILFIILPSCWLVAMGLCGLYLGFKSFVKTTEYN